MTYRNKGIPSHGLDDLVYLADLVIWLVSFNQFTRQIRQTEQTK